MTIPGVEWSKIRRLSARVVITILPPYDNQGYDIMTPGRLADTAGLRLLLAALSLFGPVSAGAGTPQQADAGERGTAVSVPQEQDFFPDSGDTIDEITVVGPRSLVIIQRQIERADFEMYGIANSLIDDPLYKTYCHRETEAGSNIKRRVCAAGYERELMSEAWEEERAMGRMGEGNYSFNYKLPEAQLREYRENMKQKMIELAAESPELAAAIYRRARLQRDYEAEQERRQQKEE